MAAGNQGAYARKQPGIISQVIGLLMFKKKEKNKTFLLNNKCEFIIGEV